MSEKTMTVVIRADDTKFGPAMKRIEGAAKQSGATIQKEFSQAASQGTDRLNSSLNKMIGLAGGLIAFQQIKNAFGSVITAALEDERTMTMLNATWTATGRTADISTAQIENQAMAFEKLTGVSHDQYLESEALLAIYDRISSDAFPRILSVASDLSKLMKTDMSTATKQLAFALDDPIGGYTRLQKAGIKFTDEQKNTIKGFAELGDIVGADNVILTILEGKLGPITAKIGASGVGTVDKFASAFGTLKDSFGATIIESDAFKSSLTRMTDEFYKMADNKELMNKFSKTITGGIETVKNTAESLAPIIGTIGSVTKTALDGFNALPTIIQQFGIIGATLWGWEGLTLLTAGSASYDITTDLINKMKTITPAMQEMDAWAKKNGIKPKQETLSLETASMYSGERTKIKYYDNGAFKIPQYDEAAWAKYKKYLKDTEIGATAAKEGMAAIMDWKFPTANKAPTATEKEEKNIKELLKLKKEYDESWLKSIIPGTKVLTTGYFTPQEPNIGQFATAAATGFNTPKETKYAEPLLGMAAPYIPIDFKQQEDDQNKIIQLHQDTAQEIIMLDLDGSKQRKALLQSDFEYEYGLMKDDDAMKIAARQKLDMQLLNIDKDAPKQQKDAWISFGDTIASTMETAMMQAGNSFTNIEKAFKNMLASMVAQYAARAAVFMLLNALTGGGFGGGISLSKFVFGNLFSGKSSGGDVYPGQPYIVGEKRRELFIPKTAGKIIPDIPKYFGTNKSITTAYKSINYSKINSTVSNNSQSTISNMNEVMHLHFYNTPKERQEMAVMSDRQFAEKFKTCFRDGKIKKEDLKI